MPKDNLTCKRIAISIQYDGSSFCGWQRQKDQISVQSVLEESISFLDPLRPVNVIAAGRTDAGVHASAQVAHFDSSGFIPVEKWPSALNGRLPSAINITTASWCPDSWHACYSAIFRRYRYTIYNGKKPNLFLYPWSWHKYQYRLDEKLMRLALEGLIGFHDFSAFQKSGSTRPDGFTTIQDTQIQRKGDVLIVEIQASGFLYGMVRLIMGQLVAVGEHKISLKTFESRWKECLRSEVKESAPAKGLCLIKVGYKDAIFKESIVFDSFPSFLLSTEDSPMKPS